VEAYLEGRQSSRMEEAYLEGRQSSRGMSIWSLSSSGMQDGIKNPNLCCVERNSLCADCSFVFWASKSYRKPNWAFSGPESEIPSRIDGNRWESMALSHRFVAQNLLFLFIDSHRWESMASSDRFLPSKLSVLSIDSYRWESIVCSDRSSSVMLSVYSSMGIDGLCPSIPIDGFLHLAHLRLLALFSCPNAS
jgi:hypothetical protein